MWATQASGDGLLRHALTRGYAPWPDTGVKPAVPASQLIAYDVASAATATGVSQDVIRRAIPAGDIAATSPRVDGRQISKLLIPADELRRWALDEPRPPTAR